MASKVYLCRGSGCRKRKAEGKSIRRALEDAVEIEHVRCQKICKGPVVGVKVGSSLEWFRKLDAEDLVGLRKTMKTGKVPKLLAKKRAKKRTGKLRE